MANYKCYTMGVQNERRTISISNAGRVCFKKWISIFSYNADCKHNKWLLARDNGVIVNDTFFAAL